LYGLCPLLRAATYSFDKEGDFVVVHSTACLVGLAFTGGCLAPALFLMPLLWRKWAAAFLAVGILIASLLFCHPASLNGFPCLEPISHPGIEIQLALWAVTGISVLVLILLEIRASRDPKSLLLVLWMAGTFVFAVFLNWTINARSILPMAPALGILIARRLERNYPASFPTGLSALCTAIAAALTLYVTEADCLTAIAVRQNVRSIYANFGPNMKQIRFQGHWGFQYYMSQLGASPLDFKSDILRPGDLIAIPSDNTNLLPPRSGKAVLVEVY
jgi:hypothetical protein